MPLHLLPVIAAAMGYAGAHEFEAPQPTDSTDSEYPTDDNENHSLKESTEKRIRQRSSGREKSVSFSEGVTELNGIKSLYSSRTSLNQHRHMEVLWRSLKSVRCDDNTSQFDSMEGFIHGNFGSGRVKDIKLSTGCWVMKYSTRADLLAVGLKKQVDFLETTHYTTIYSLPFTGKVSAIQWCPASALGSKSTSAQMNHAALQNSSIPTEGHLIAVAGLDGHVAIYRLHEQLVEFQGVELVHEFHVNSQVRCMALSPLCDGQVLLVTGDKQGKITLTTLSCDPEGQINSSAYTHIESNGDGVLGLDVSVTKSLLAVSTKSGKLLVFKLSNTEPAKGETRVICPSKVWTQQRNGEIRSVVFGRDGRHIAFGGYDKNLVFVDTDLFAVVREVALRGTINTIAMDPLDRFLVVGCRDKSLTFFDTTTFFPVKRFQTQGWVTSISWGNPGLWNDIVAVRSENKRISLLDLTPINITDVSLSAGEGPGNSASWSATSKFLARIDGDTIRVADSRRAFSEVAALEIPDSSITCLSFQPKSVVTDHDELDECNDDLLAAVGQDGNLYLLSFSLDDGLKIVDTVFVEKNLWIVSWSKDGDLLAVGGKGKLGGKGKALHIYSVAHNLVLQQSTQLDKSVWDIAFMKSDSNDDTSRPIRSVAVASGDYTAIIFDTKTLEPTLQVIRPQTVRCLDYHPNQSLLAVGDGAGIVAIVDYVKEQTVHEFEIGGRVNVLSYSPAGDYLIIGTDECIFTLHETEEYKVVQEFQRDAFALTASFSPNGKYLVLGSSNEPYEIVRMGPLLGIDLVPLNNGVLSLPSWAMKETLFRSGFGPSLVQRHMIHGSQDSLQWVAKTLREYPDTIYTRNRLRKEGCFDTALRLRKMKLLQLAVTALVDGSLEAKNDGRRSILTTDLPEVGKSTLEAMVARHPPELIVDILKHMTFVKVPFTRPHVVSRDKQKYCASPLYLDPWKNYRFVGTGEDEEGALTKTAAVLPIPGLGTFAFLSALVSKAPATVFDNEAMALVLRVMWQNHIRRYFILDTFIFLSYYTLWIMFMEFVSARDTSAEGINRDEKIIAIFILTLNTLFGVKEMVQSNFGRRAAYFSSFWNQVDIASIVLVYVFSVMAGLHRHDAKKLIPLAVITTLLLTMKLISYLRAFHETGYFSGWLVTVLSQNFEDAKGFLVVLFSILVGFAASFRLLFSNNLPSCGIELDSKTKNLIRVCDENPFGTLRKSILSTFELTILATYEPSVVYESNHPILAILVFVGAVTCVLVIVLNALISLLADSYARVQENAAANRRKEKAQLIVEYMSLLTPWRRRQIEAETKYFHALLEADADGDLVVDGEDWHGGLHALREDLEESATMNAEAHQRAIEAMRKEFEKEMSSFRNETLSILQELSEDVKRIQDEQAKGLGNITGKRVAGAVKAVRNIQRRGSEFWRTTED